MSRLTEVFDAIDAANRLDPTHEDGVPAALVYGYRMSERLRQFENNPSEALQISLRGQHIERWLIARSDYPMNKAGYYAWRNAQKIRHSERLQEIAAGCGYNSDVLQRIAAIVTKKNLGADPETQILEDVACLVFLEYYAAHFASKFDESKVIDILRKTARKMSKKGAECARNLPLNPAVKTLLERALTQA